MGKDSFTIQVDPEFEITPESVEFYRECVRWARFLTRFAEKGISLKLDIVGRWNADGSPIYRASFHWNGRFVTAFKFREKQKNVRMDFGGIEEEHYLYAHDKIAPEVRKAFKYAVKCEESRLHDVAFRVRDDVCWHEYLEDEFGARPQGRPPR